MGRNKRKENRSESDVAHDDMDMSATNTFNIQVYTDEGHLISEYTLDDERDQVFTLAAAEKSARKKMKKYLFEPLVLIVSEQTLTKIRQIQVKVAKSIA